MKRYFLDTSVIIAYLQGEEKIVEKVDNIDGELISSYVCLAELYEGIYRVKEQQQVEKQVLEFFSGLTSVIGLDEEIARMFGNLRKTLKQKGMIIEDMDLLVAATSIVNNASLVTLNVKHFERIEKLQILL